MVTKILSISRVKPNNPTLDASLYAGYNPSSFTTYNTSEHPVIPLSALDKNNYSSVTLFYGYTSSAFPSSITSFSSLVEKLSSSLSQLLDYFPILAGTFEYIPDEKIGNIILDGSGVVLVQSENSELSLTDLTNIEHQSIELAKHFSIDSAALKTQYPSIQHYPLIVQVTKLKCSSVILTLQTSHALLDGTSYETFQSTWSKLALGMTNVDKPDLQQFLYHNRIDDSIVSEMPTGWAPVPKSSLLNPSNDSQLPPVYSKLYYLSQSKILHLKEEITAVLSSQGFPHFISSDDVVTAVFWRAITKIRQLAPNSTSSLIRPTNIRSFESPPIPPNAIGNFAMTHHTSLLVSELSSPSLIPSLVEICKQIRMSMLAFDHHKIRRNYKYFAELPPETACSMNFQSYDVADIFINSWKKFTTLANFDLGFGSNSFVLLPPIANGMVIFFPTNQSNLPGVIAHVYLPPNQLKELSNDQGVQLIMSDDNERN
ncbi:hypothetical protein K7432_010435 [Basidiobolus ranarum]|uniref:Uncharacterized protein n=1 Tax=Basidiobolus ranarum TaxID=34480 RepID=A0ABR2VVF5_9FUNG